ncbi:F420-dependent methylenetetrahydromethanopterin dehydrogenase [Archaeoglobus profundus]|uniref:F420-dependent methylenetetrahydromethanopterin dehydrogenase n=1 Tax=Archaeoglobus profundus (strain DSM 5631 / JCM 9629 / NBRC 100127 / Av18) TaxID=572546 RepID=D2RET8_ARCPA|nr:F420-dependent methylenetetrahydromethanopterin dehydrogenase [Archaeoglobus profundus]ADB58632.1 Methylenetetrahydromethanopterin dehydrogenase [Archaeoglobus profundus DSM 5631]
MRIGIAKLGAIGSAVLLEYCLDELAMRGDIETFVVSSGSKIKVEVLEELEKRDFDLKIVTCPNAEKFLKDVNLSDRVIVITDRASKDWLDSLNWGYIVVKADAMIGARREFLDPTEMVLYNSDLLKVLAVTGIIRLLQYEINRALKEDYLPKVVVDYNTAVKFAGFCNPYARAKAIASYIIAENISKITHKACFVEKDAENYITLCATAHEMMRIAGKLADEAREIEKSNDSVLRTPHSKSGEILKKVGLYDVLM